MLLAHQTSDHVCSTVSCSYPRSSTSAPQKTENSFGPDFQLSDCFVVIVHGNHVEHTDVGNPALVFDPTALHFHMRSSHGFSMLVCSRLEG